MEVKVDGERYKGLIDSGCSRSIIGPKVRINTNACYLRSRGSVFSFDGRPVPHQGEAVVDIDLVGVPVRVTALCCGSVLPGIDVIVGMDVLNSHTVLFDKGNLSISSVAVAPMAHRIRGKGFEAWFDGSGWTTHWDWIGSPVLKKKISGYKVPEYLRDKFIAGVRRWIGESWLEPREGGIDPAAGLIPLMAVQQESKDKTRPVLDYRELNQFVPSSGVNADVCADTLRTWRQFPEDCAILDLQDAYMQVRVHDSCSRLQMVEFEGKLYELKRMGFGLACAPQILKEIVTYVLSLDPTIKAECNAYYDDILVDLSAVSAEFVAAHLQRFGLKTKPPKRLEGGTALGLAVYRYGDRLRWERIRPVHPSVDGMTTKREFFGICGRLTSHYPVAGWLRVATAFAKRACTDGGWDAPLTPEAKAVADALIKRLRDEGDPVGGVWKANSAGPWRVWCDASSTATAVVLDCDGATVEDGAWIRKKKDPTHINFAELVAVLKGVNMALRWKVKNLHIITDSSTVCGWLKSLAADERVRVSGDGELLVRRRLELIKNLLADVEWTVGWVPSPHNKADPVSRVLPAWLKLDPAASAIDIAREAHNEAHRGVDATLYMARQIDPAVARSDARRVVEECVPCGEIDPQPVRLKRGTLAVDSVWSRVACDVTHVGSEKYLTAIDCGPSGFAIWQRIHRESDVEIAKGIHHLFERYGPPDQLHMDNGTAFRSGRVKALCDEWQVQRLFRGAHKPRGHGIIERNHRSVKRTRARRGCSVEEAVLAYNTTPRGPWFQIPIDTLFGRRVNNRFVKRKLKELSAPEESAAPEAMVKVGDPVVSRPPNARCDTPWNPGTVTEVNSEWNVDVDGMSRNVQDVRRSRRYEDVGVEPGGNVIPAPGMMLEARSETTHAEEETERAEIDTALPFADEQSETETAVSGESSATLTASEDGQESKDETGAANPVPDGEPADEGPWIQVRKSCCSKMVYF